MNASEALRAITCSALCALALPVRASDPAVEPLTISKQTTWITEPLRADGTPDYIAWLRRKHGEDEPARAEAAAVLNEMRLAVTGSKPDGLEQAVKARFADGRRLPGLDTPPASFARAFETQQRRALAGPWRPKDAPLIALWLELDADNLRRADAAVAMGPRLWTLPADGPRFDWQMPSRLNYRTLAHAMRARSLSQESWANPDTARGAFIAGLRLAALVDQGPWLIDRLVGLALRGLATEPVAALANPPPTRRDAAAALLRELLAVPPSPSLEEVIQVDERVLVLSGYADLYRSARQSEKAWHARLSALVDTYEAVGATLLRSPPPRNLRHIPAALIDWNEVFRRVNECWQNAECDAGFAEAALELKSPAFERLLDQARTQPAARQRMARAFMALESPSPLMRSYVVWNEQQALRRTALVSAAAALWHADHDRYPESAGALASGAASVGFDPATDAHGYGSRYVVAASGRGFAFVAVPLEPGTSGVRAFCADGSGRLATTNTPAPDAAANGLCPSDWTTLAARTPFIH